MLIGPHATTGQIEEFRAAILADPRGYIAQPRHLCHVHPHLRRHCQGRHIDLRPYSLRRENEHIPGGLTRVALRKGSLVVNSSQGGGSKDTWVLDEEDEPQSQTQTQVQ
jgi:uncharacterized circularly permuted ATP-grasp superfamily protein